MTHRTVISDYDSCVGINLGFLTDEELGMIHSGALEVLWNCGVSVEAKEAQELLAEAGANVDFETGIVKFPEWLVEESLRSVPSQFTLYGRDDSHDIVIGGNRVHMSTFGQATKAVDLETGETRPSTLQDLSDQALLTDALPEIDITERSLTANDAPYAPLAPLYEAAKVMPNTVKPMVYGPGNGYCAQKIIDMAAAAAGGHEALRQKPSLIINICLTSPLKIAPGACNAIIAAARAGIPNNILTMALAGVTAPITLAGTLVVHVAEFLAALTLNQAACKGSAVIIGTSDTEFDMMTMQTPVGSPEMAVLAAACARIGRYYNVPSWVGGGQADSKLCDFQSGHEKTITAMMAMMSGANLIYGAGMLESGLTFSYGQLVLDNETFKMVRRLMQGIEVSDETLAVDDVIAAGPGGDFMTDDLTMKYLRGYHSQSTLFDRNNIENWKRATNGRDSGTMATEMARSLIATHRPSVELSEDVIAEFDKIIAEAEAEVTADPKVVI